jgi:two-component system, chemotaxis family, CheB/CheR fusion protein
MRDEMESKSSRRETRPDPDTDGAHASTKRTNDFLIAAIGASAGGIEAFVDLLRNLSADTGMAFVFVQHLDPKHHSILTELLSKETRMSVVEVTDGMRVSPTTFT